MLGRLRSMLAQPGFAVLLALGGLAVFNWPFPEMIRADGDLPLFLYYFGAWASAIVIAFLVAWASSGNRSGDGDDV